MEELINEAEKTKGPVSILTGTDKEGRQAAIKAVAILFNFCYTCR